MRDKILGGLIGHTVGDALGVAGEFRSRDYLRKNPVTEMRPVMAHFDPKTIYQPAGTWSDDASMSLALADSLLIVGKYDSNDIMQRFSAWYHNGDYTPFGECWDIGNICSVAIDKFDKGIPAEKCGGTSERDNGNGSLMRILPIMFYLQALYSDFTKSDEVFNLIHTVSALTHAHIRSQIACGIYLSIAESLMNPDELIPAVQNGLRVAEAYYGKDNSLSNEMKHFSRIYKSDFANTPEDDINSGGYVVDTLEASLWCLLNTDNYADCVIKAVNLGDDADTTAAVVGGLAGIYYGFDAIPQKWIDALKSKEFVFDIYERFTEFVCSLNKLEE